jgi:hypothetical protein
MLACLFSKKDARSPGHLPMDQFHIFIISIYGEKARVLLVAGGNHHSPLDKLITNSYTTYSK